jgi:hypothetical protein
MTRDPLEPVLNMMCCGFLAMCCGLLCISDKVDAVARSVESLRGKCREKEVHPAKDSDSDSSANEKLADV